MTSPVRSDAETPSAPERGRSRTDQVTTKVGIWLVVLLAVIALVVAYTAKSGPPEARPGAMVLPESAPLRVSIPSIKAASTLVPLGQNPDRSLIVPPLNQPQQASWYDKSPTPGELGPSVILGHVNGDGKPGIFAQLSRLKPGQQILIDRADGQTAVFTVARVDTVPKDGFPTNRVYGDTADAELRLITCGGTLDRAAHNYLSNVVAYAALTSVHKT